MKPEGEVSSLLPSAYSVVLEFLGDTLARGGRPATQSKVRNGAGTHHACLHSRGQFREHLVYWVVLPVAF